MFSTTLERLPLSTIDHSEDDGVDNADGTAFLYTRGPLLGCLFCAEDTETRWVSSWPTRAGLECRDCLNVLAEERA